MTSRDFCYWLQGFFEITQTGPKPPEYSMQLHGSQVESIQKHLNMVFKHEIDPSFGDDEKQKGLDKIHTTQAPVAGHLRDRFDYPPMVRC